MCEKPVLLYDGLCGFCNGTVRFILKHDTRGVLRFAPLQGVFARGVMGRHAELAGVDSLILVEYDPANGAERVHVRSNSVLRLATYLGGGWTLVQLLRVVPTGVRDWIYDIIARFRYRIFGVYQACPRPDPDQRARFLD